MPYSLSTCIGALCALRSAQSGQHLVLLIVSLAIAMFLRQRDLDLPSGTDIGLGPEGIEAAMAEGREAEAREAEVAESATKPLA